LAKASAIISPFPEASLSFTDAEGAGEAEAGVVVVAGFADVAGGEVPVIAAAEVVVAVADRLDAPVDTKGAGSSPITCATP
jgi:hypothetical protein